MALEAPKFRYSTDAIMTSDEAKKFPWEKPIPVNSFWDSFPYCHARSVLHNFEVDNETLRIDPESTDDHLTKSLLLIQLLQDKLARAEAAAPPPGSLHDSNYKKWYPIWQGIYALQEGAGLPDAESTVRMLVATRPVEGLEDNVVPPHMLAELLVKREQYEEAEEVEKPVLAWIDAKPHLGRESPQAINARRFIAKALWFQGPSRRTEAEALVAEIHAIVEGMGNGTFKDYQEEEKTLNEAMMVAIRERGMYD